MNMLTAVEILWTCTVACVTDCQLAHKQALTVALVKLVSNSSGVLLLDGIHNVLLGSLQEGKKFIGLSLLEHWVAQLYMQVFLKQQCQHTVLAGPVVDCID